MKKTFFRGSFAAAAARVFVILTVLCLCLSALPLLTPDCLPAADAAEPVTYHVPVGATPVQIEGTLGSYPSGTTVNMILGGDVDLTEKVDAEFIATHDSFGIVVPAGLTVNLYMNSHNILFDRPNKDANSLWQLHGLYGIENNGTLNIFSGAGPDSPNISAASNTAACIKLVNKREGMKTNESVEYAYSMLYCIKNNSILNVGKHVTFYAASSVKYDDRANNCTANAVAAAVGILNGTSTAECVLNGNVMHIEADACGLMRPSDPTHSDSYAYGVYGGNVKVRGQKANISVYAGVTMALKSTSTSARKSQMNAVSYGIATNGKVEMTGGTIEARGYANEVVGTVTYHPCEKGAKRVYSGGIITTSGSPPTVIDGNVLPATAASLAGEPTQTEVALNAAVAKSVHIPLTPEDYLDNHVRNNKWKENQDFPQYPIEAGQFLDEYGNSYDAVLTTSYDGQATPISRGALSGTNKYRVHVIYRYWLNTQKTAIDESIVGTSGLKGYSYLPLGDGTHIVKNAVVLNGIESSTSMLKDDSAGVSYSEGGAVKNGYYWSLLNLAWAKGTAVFSDFDVTAPGNRGTAFQSFTSTNPQHGTVGASASSPIYIFVDYVKKEPISIKASAGTSNTASAVYTGDNIKASAIGLKILDSVTDDDFTSEYNIDFDNGAKIPINFSYTGTTAAGTSVTSESGRLPKDAGTYHVTLHIDDTSSYSEDPVLHKNRRGLDYEFTLVIEQASVLRGSLPTQVSLTYGQKLNEILSFDSYSAEGLGGDGAVTGVFNFENAVDGSSYKNAGEQNVTIVWSPVYGTTANVKNYKQTSFTVSCTVNKAGLTIRPNRAETQYGSAEFSTPFSATFDGLVANDNTDAVKAAITGALSFTVQVNNNYVAYAAGDVYVGTYPIRTVFNVPPAVMGNYEYSFIYGPDSNPEGVLSVTKRGLTVKAKAAERGYDVSNHNVDVSFEITDGRFGSDDVRVVDTVGGLSDNQAGYPVVGGITKPKVEECLQGGSKGNYYVKELTFDTGEVLIVHITQGVPNVTTPTVADIYYRRTRQLSDIVLANVGSSVPGYWHWSSPDTNPTVAVDTYEAEFIPDDQINYTTKTAQVHINVKPSPVVITYGSTVQYGDNVPNITAYTYECSQDPDFDITAVNTAGNITPSTTYTKGSPVNTDGYPVHITAPNFRDIDGNYTFSTRDGVITVTPRTVVFTIKDKEINYGDNFVPSAGTVDITYDENALVGDDTIAAITSNSADPSFSFSSTFNYQTSYDTGAYDITAVPAFTTSPSYSVEIIPGVLTVKKVPLVIRGDSIELAYNSPVPANLQSAFTLEGAVRSEGLDRVLSAGSITVDTSYVQGSHVSAAGYPINIDISGATFNNYEVSVESGLITVIKASPVIDVYPEAHITYTQTLADAVFTGGSVNVDGHFAYNLSTAAPGYRVEPYENYAAVFIPNDTLNYNTISEVYIPLYVSKKPVSGALAVSGMPMNGETLTADTSGLEPSDMGLYTFVWKDSDNNTTLGTGTALVLAEEHVGRVITLTATASGSYEGSASVSTTAVAPKLTSVQTILLQDNWGENFELSGLDAYNGSTTIVYDAAEKPVNFALRPSSDALVGAITVKYNGSEIIPKNVGTYRITIDIGTPQYTGNITERGGKTYNENSGKYVYSPVSGFVIGTLTITPAGYTVTVTVANKVYDGYTSAEALAINQQGACTVPGGGLDDVSFNTEAAAYFFDTAAAGQNKPVHCTGAALKGSAAANYALTLVLDNDAKATVMPRPYKVAVIPVPREYAEGVYDVDLSFETDVTSLAPTDNIGNVYVNLATAKGLVDDFSAGPKNVTVSGVELAGSKAANYILEITNAGSLTVEIEKAVPAYPIPSTETLSYDAARTLNSVSLGNSHWRWDDSVINVCPTAGRHSFNAVYTPDDTQNFAEVIYSVPVEVRKAVVNVAARSFSVVYGETEPTYRYDVMGLTGTDTLSTAVQGYVLMNCNYAPGSDVGRYPVLLDGNFVSENYYFVYQNGNVSVTQRPVYTDALPVSREYDPGCLDVQVNFSPLSNIYSGDSTTQVYLAGDFPITGHIDTDTPGMKTVSFEVPSLTGDKAANYELKLVNDIVKVEILKARLPGVVLPTTATIGYGQRLSAAVFTSSYAGTEYGTFQMKNPMATPEAVGTFSNLYKVVFTPNNTILYAAIEEYITLTVEPSHLDISLSLTGTAQVGKSLYVVVSDLPAGADEYIRFFWYRVDARGANPNTGVMVASGTDRYTLTDDDKGKFIVCVAKNVSDSPYLISANVSTDVAITLPRMSFWQKLLRWLYKLISNLTQIFGRGLRGL